MVTPFDVPAQPVIEEAAAELEDEFDSVETPEWAEYAKTGQHVERRPQQENWWYIRSAALLRQLYMNGPVGVRRLQTRYGGRKNRGHAPEKQENASGNVIRTALQQLEDAGLVETEEGEGRILTSDGQQFLDNAAHTVANNT